MSRRPAILDERRWLALILLVLLAMGQAATMVIAAFATRHIFVFLRDGGDTVPNGSLATVAIAGLALCLLRSLEGRCGERAGQSYAAAIRRALFRHMTRMPASDVARRRSGALALRYVGDLAAFKGWIARGVPRLISAVIIIPTALFVLYLLEPVLFMAAIGPIAAIMVCMLLISRPLATAHAELRSKRSRLAAAMAERLPQGIALRRSGRARIELKQLQRKSLQIADASVHRAWLSATVRALPDAASGVAAALCMLVCIQLGLGMPDAVAALMALAMVVLPLRHLADVTDRRRAYVVASGKLDKFMDAPQLPAPRKVEAAADAPAIDIAAVQMPNLTPFDMCLGRGAQRRLTGPAGCGKSTLLLALAGFDLPPSADRFEVLGSAPGSQTTGRVLYLGRQAAQLKGSLRREATIGIGRTPDDQEVINAFRRAGLTELSERIGGPDGQIAEGRRNLTASEQSRLHLARALLARPTLALIDADEIGLDRPALSLLIDHLQSVGAAALVVTSDPAAALRLGAPMELKQEAHKAQAVLPEHRTVPGQL